MSLYWEIPTKWQKMSILSSIELNNECNCVSLGVYFFGILVHIQVHRTLQNYLVCFNKFIT